MSEGPVGGPGGGGGVEVGTQSLVVVLDRVLGRGGADGETWSCSFPRRRIGGGTPTFSRRVGTRSQGPGSTRSGRRCHTSSTSGGADRTAVSGPGVAMLGTWATQVPGVGSLTSVIATLVVVLLFTFLPPPLLLRRVPRVSSLCLRRP